MDFIDDVHEPFISKKLRKPSIPLVDSTGKQSREEIVAAIEARYDSAIIVPEPDKTVVQSPPPTPPAA